MPVTPTFPGVYVEEIPSGVHTIVGVATSIAAFVDTFARGPLDYAVQLLSMSDFERIMGGLDTTSEASYAIQQFFLNGGSEAYAVRVAPIKLPPQGAAVIGVFDKPGGVLSFTATAGQKIGDRILINPGAWGNNVRLDVDYNTTDPKKLFNLSISEVDSGKVLQSEVFRNLNMTVGDPAYAVDVVNDGSRIVFLAPPPSSPAPLPAASGALSGNLPPLKPKPAPPLPLSVKDGATFTVTADGDAYTCTLSLPKLPVPPPADYLSLRPYLESAIRGGIPIGTAPLNNPLLTGATVQLVGNQYRVLAGRGGNTSNADSILTTAMKTPDTFAKDLMLDSTVPAPDQPVFNIQQYSLNGKKGGAQDNGVAGTIDVTAIHGDSIRGLEASKTGLYALDDVDLFNILCIPAATPDATSVKLSKEEVEIIIAEATVYCDAHRAMFIVDVPQSVKDLPGMQVWMTQNDTLRDKNLAVYFPRVRIPDPLNGSRLRDVGSSGTVAGIWAATDVNRGVWKAPAGVDTQLRNVPQFVYNLVDRENGVLNPLGINCLRNFPIYGNVSWGARTLLGADVQASEWKYIPIRRLALFLEESLFRGTKWVVFEPNDEPLWAQIRMNVTSFMHDLFRQGAFQGTTPEKAYLVKCDAEINTQFEIDRGIVNILVGFAPLKPAEFVILQIQQLAGQTPA